MDTTSLVAISCYALLFWAVASRFPGVALALIFALGPFQSDIGGGLGGVRFSVSEVNIVLALPLLVGVFLQGEKQFKLWPFFWPCVLYFAVCLASGLVQWRGSAALTSLFQMLLFMFVVIAVFAYLARRPEDMLLALWSSLGVATFLAIMLVITRSQYVLGLHKNGVGSSISCAFLVALELYFHYQSRRSWHKWAIIGAAVVLTAGLLISLSRGAWLGALGGVLLIVAMRRQFGLLLRIALAMVPIVALAWNLLPQDSREYATSFDAKRGNISQRFLNNDLALAEWQKSPILGDGVGIRKQYDATQLVLFTLAETGILGLASFALALAVFFAMVWRTQKTLERDSLAYSLLAIGGSLMLSRLLHGMVDHYWTRGPTVMGWAAAGMASHAVWVDARSSSGRRLAKAKSLLALHLLERGRRERRGQGAPPLSRRELERANQALSLIKNSPPQARRDP